MRLLTIPALLVAALLSTGCLPPVDQSLPAQRAWPLQTPAGCEADAGASPASITGLLPADPTTSWRWTTPAIDAEFPALAAPPSGVVLRCFVAGEVRRATDDQTLLLTVNGQPAGRRQLLGEGEKNIEWTIPPGALRPGQPIRLRIEIRPAYLAPDGARLGVLLHSLRLLRSAP